MRAFEKIVSRTVMWAASVGFLLVSTTLLAQSAFEDEVVVGGEAGWDDVLTVANAQFRPGRRNLDVAVLRDQRYVPRADTDLLLQFDEPGISDRAGNYTVIESDVDISRRDPRRGEAAGRFRGDDTGVVLRTGPLSAFRPGRVWDDIAIEFWLNPARIQEGAEILSWRGVLLHEGNVMHQRLSVTVGPEGRLTWDFQNIFVLPDLEPFDLSVSTRTALVPQRWGHHRLEFSAGSGMVEYLVDGELEAVAYTTETGTAGGTVRIPYVGAYSGDTLHIGAGFAGLLDELRIEEFRLSPSFLERYGTQPGRIITRSFDLQRPGATVSSLEMEQRLAEQTDTALFVRSGSRMDADGHVRGEWNAVEDLDEMSGQVLERFVQFRIELYPDGAGERTPEVQRIALRYQPNRPPGPPGRVRARAGDRNINLQWSEAPGADVQGYRVYYGSRPGEFLGEDANEGVSPIDVGDTTEFELTGLENGRLYYISVVAYDEVTDDEGTRSEEVTARPLRR